MYAVLAMFLAALSLFGQTASKGAAKGAVKKQQPHRHALQRICKGQPDIVYGKQDGVYYACVKGKEVCSNERAAIPARMIAAYEDSHRPVEATIEEYRAGLKAERPTKAAVMNVDAPAARTPAPPRTPIADDRLKEIAIGTSLDEVIQKLGEPYMKIAGSVDSATYLLASKGRAQLTFVDGKLAQLRILPAQ